jgi:kojibiose phosphorylase
VEDGFALLREHEIESLFAVSNGYAGSRASLEEGCALSTGATFLAGIFEQRSTPGSVPQLMAFPEWSGIRVSVDGNPFDMSEGEVLEHRRTLDLKQGILWREWRHRDLNGRITRLLTLRLASLVDRHVLLQSLLFTAENYSARLHLECSIELGSLLDPEVPQDWKTPQDAERPMVFPVSTRVPGRQIKVAFAIASQLLNESGEDSDGEREITINDACVSEKFCTAVGLGAQCQLHRAVSIYTSRDVQEPGQAAVIEATNVMPTRVEAAVSAHASEWRGRWESADVQIQGDDSLQRALRFALYHLISAANPEDSRVSIGARALTGEAYKGHVFWDTEIYMVPFFMYTHPASARALLTYRYHTLEAAREKARSFGFRGAMYPWESADTGEETTPKAVITPTGEVIEVRNGEMEVHISGDVAYAVWQYWSVTGDDAFLLDNGAEIILETARFWASRGNMEADGAFHIRHVIGPDEYHEDVDDSAYTNLLAAWNLRRGAQVASLLKTRWLDRWRDLVVRLKISEDELAHWLSLADAMFISFDQRTLLFEQFTGYYKKDHVDLQQYEPRSAAMDIILGHERIQQTDVIKQADVVLAVYLLWDDLPADVRATNFRYYEPRTGHGSSLSPSIHALVAARLGDMALAERYLRQSAQIDLGNTMGNAAGGVHAAALGGLWQAIVFGFAGLRQRPDGIYLAPNLPPNWHQLSFPMQWRNNRLQVSVLPNKIRVAVKGAHPIRLGLANGAEVTAVPDREYSTVRDQQGWSAWYALH